MASLASKEKAIKAMFEVQKIFKETCGMEVHKILSNVKEVLMAMDPKKRLKEWKDGDDLPSTKVFGMKWDPNLDLMNITNPKGKECPNTK